MTIISTVSVTEAAESNASQRETPPNVSGGWRLVILLALLLIVGYADRTLFAILATPIKVDLHLTDVEIGLLLGLAYALSCALTSIPMGALIDRWHRGRITGLTMIATSLITAATGFMSTFAGLFAARAGLGVSEAALAPAAYSLLSDRFGPSRLSRAISLYSLGVPIGAGVGFLFGGLATSALERVPPRFLGLFGVRSAWQAVFLLTAAPGIVLGIIALICIKDHRQRDPIQSRSSPASFTAVAKFLAMNRKAYGSSVVGRSVVQAYGTGAILWFPQVLQREDGLSLGLAAALFGTSTLILGSLSMLFSGWLADRLMAAGRRDAHTLIDVFYASGLLLFGVLSLLLPPGPIRLTFLTIAPFFGNTTVGAAAAQIQLLTPARMRGQVSGLYVVVLLVFIGAGPPLVALVSGLLPLSIDRPLSTSLALVGGPCLICGSALRLWGRSFVIRLMSDPLHGAAQRNDPEFSSFR